MLTIWVSVMSHVNIMILHQFDLSIKWCINQIDIDVMGYVSDTNGMLIIYGTGAWIYAYTYLHACRFMCISYYLYICRHTIIEYVMPKDWLRKNQNCIFLRKIFLKDIAWPACNSAVHVKIPPPPLIRLVLSIFIPWSLSIHHSIIKWTFP